MAVALDELRAVMRMELNPFMRDLQKMHGVSARSARMLESTWLSTNRRMDNIGRNMARSLIAPITGISAALSANAVMHYADAWTSAKNSLAVAGVSGEKQIDVMDRLYASAQENAAPLVAMSDLYGKAAQAGDNLGASQAELLKFTDGVGVSLRVAGASAASASGALTQLGQLLGQARVQAEEFNSINEGARPILLAVAAGLDEAGDSVSRLKQLVNDGEVSGRQFFQAFLKGLPVVQAMAANATQTIEQGMTKVNNAFTKYIGQSDETLGASQRLVAGLNSLADNFDATADAVLKVAAVIAGALVGRSIGGMIASLGLASAALVRFVSAMRAASTMAGLATAMGGLSAAAGPIGAVVGVAAVGALALFASTSDEASVGAVSYAKALDQVRQSAEAAAPAIEGAAAAISEKTRNALQAGVAEGLADIEAAKAAVIDLFDHLFRNVDRDTISADQLQQLEDLKSKLENGKISAEAAEGALFKLANSNPNFQAVANAFSPLLQALQNSIAATGLLKEKLAALDGGDTEKAYRQYTDSRIQGEEMLRLGRAYSDEAQRQNSLSKEQLAVEKEIASIKKDLAEKGGFLPESEINKLAASNVAAVNGRKESGRSSGVKQTADSNFAADIQAIRDRTAALIEEQKIVGLSYVEQERRRMALDLEQTTLRDLREEARRKGATDLEAIQLSAEQRQRIDEVTAAYARQADALRVIEDETRNSQNAAQEFYDTSKSNFMDVVTGAKSLGDALLDLGKKFADLALNSAFDAIFGGASASASGGWLTGIFKAIGFSNGGYTGAGGRNQPAGIVHKGEVVWSQTDVARAGGVGAVENLRLNGVGGLINTSAAPSVASIVPQSSVSAPISITIDATGADAAGLVRVERQLDALRRELPSTIVKTVKSAEARRVL